MTDRFTRVGEAYRLRPIHHHLRNHMQPGLLAWRDFDPHADAGVYSIVIGRYCRIGELGQQVRTDDGRPRLIPRQPFRTTVPRRTAPGSTGRLSTTEAANPLSTIGSVRGRHSGNSPNPRCMGRVGNAPSSKGSISRTLYRGNLSPVPWRLTAPHISPGKARHLTAPGKLTNRKRRQNTIIRLMKPASHGSRNICDRSKADATLQPAV